MEVITPNDGPKYNVKNLLKKLTDYDKLESEIVEKENLTKFKLLNSQVKVQKNFLSTLDYICYEKTKFFDDIEKIPNILDYKIHKIKIWYGNAFRAQSRSINGIQVTYKHLFRKEYITTEENMCDLKIKGYETFELKENQYISNLSLRHNPIIHSISFKTNDDSVFSVGGQGGYQRNFNLRGRVVVGLYGCYDTNLCYLGVYTISEKEYKLNLYLKKRRFSYISMRDKLLTKKDELKEVIEKYKDDKEYDCEVAFAKLCLKPKTIFASVALFIC
jgi:hypothetical protein